MTKERLDDYMEPVFNLEDLIEAREERVSAFSDGVSDIDREPDVDVEDALTFPHRHRGETRLATGRDNTDIPGKNDVGFDYNDSVEEALPTDYAESYANALSTDMDDAEVAAEEAIHELGEMTPEDIIYESPLTDPNDEGPLRDVRETTG